MKKRIYRITALLLMLSLAVLPYFESAFPARVQAASDTQGDIENPAHEMTSLDDEIISTAVTPGQPTILVFGKTDCGNTQRTIKSLADSEEVTNGTVRVIFGECNNASLAATTAFKQNYGCDSIIFCYNNETSSSRKPQAVWNDYADLGNDIGALPTTVVIDGNNKVKKILSGFQIAATLLAAINEGGTGDNTGNNTGDDTEATTGSVNVSIEGTEHYSYANEILQLVNQTREQNNLPALKLDESLLESAMQRAAELSLYYSHTRPDGSSCFTVSSRGTRKSENIAIGYSSPQAVMNGWINSPGHYANITDSEVTSIGIGCFRDSAGTWNWVQFFDNESAVEPSVSGEKQVTRTVSIKKSLLHMQINENPAFDSTDIGTKIKMNISHSNEEWSASKPGLPAANFNFSSSVLSVAEVSSDGTITLTGTGTTVITASLKSDSSVSINHTITVDGNAASNPTATPPVIPPESSAPTPIPATPTPEPATPTPEPAVPTPEPATPTPEPAVPTPEPAVPTPNPVQPTPEPEPAIPVENITGLAAKSGTDSVKLSWETVSDAEGYLIYRFDSKAKVWNEIATVKTNKNSYSVKGLEDGSTYRFAVKAYQTQNGVQSVSEAFTAIYTATKPESVNFRITAGKNKATIKWSKVKGATGYTVYYKTSKNGSLKKLKTTTSTSYTKTKLKSGKNYYFTVKAYKTYKNQTYTSSFKTKKIKIK